MILDQWQKEVMKTKGNMVLRSGRQVGKSTVIGLKAARFALENPNKLIMVISKTERQASLLFSKILFNIHQINRPAIKRGKDRPTKHIISLKNGSVIHCLPAGDTGFGIMGFTIDLLIADEAAFIPEEVWNSIVPALAITRGHIWLLSTPFIKEGYYYNCFIDPTFTSFHQSSEDCPRKDKAFLEHKRKTITKQKYAQMYLGEFLDEGRKYFSEKLILRACVLSRRKAVITSRDYFLGVDVARMGEDASTFEVVELTGDRIEQVENEITKKTYTTDTTDKILNMERKYDFRKIYIDSTGVGAGVLDQLLQNEQTKRKVVAIENVRTYLEPKYRDNPAKRKTMKEELYDNLLKLMERDEIKLLDDDEIKASLRSVWFEYNDRNRLIIDGDDTHITEGIIRAVHCIKDKVLKVWVDYI